MALSGPDFYDDEAVFKTYRAGQDRPQNAKDALEKPIFDELVGSLEGQRILDLGCGDARFGREALDAGCELYFGVEGSRRAGAVSRGRNLPAAATDTVNAFLQCPSPGNPAT